MEIVLETPPCHQAHDITRITITSLLLSIFPGFSWRMVKLEAEISVFFYVLSISNAFALMYVQRAFIYRLCVLNDLCETLKYIHDGRKVFYLWHDVRGRKVTEVKWNIVKNFWLAIKNERMRKRIVYWKSNLLNFHGNT